MKANTTDTAKAERRSLKVSAATLQSEKQGPLPVWVRAPKTGPEYFSGFTRPKLYQLAGDGAIRSVSIRQPGKQKGVRMFHLGSVLQYIERQEVSFATS